MVIIISITVTVIGLLSNEMLLPRLELAEIGTELDERNLVLVGRMGTHRKRQYLAINNSKNRDAFTAADWATHLPPSQRQTLPP